MFKLGELVPVECTVFSTSQVSQGLIIDYTKDTLERWLCWLPNLDAWAVGVYRNERSLRTIMICTKKDFHALGIKDDPTMESFIRTITGFSA